MALGRAGILALLVAALALIAPAGAGATATVGQVPAETPSSSGCPTGPVDVLQPTVSGGEGYVVPGNGTIVDWSHQAAVGSGQMLTLKVFRKVADPFGYQVVGHDGPRPIAGGTVNTFSSAIPVKSGDVLGLNPVNAVPSACVFPASGETFRFRSGNLVDGADGSFGSSDADYRTNVLALFVASNAITLNGIAVDRKAGTATLTVSVPNAGSLTVGGKGVVSESSAQARTSAAGATKSVSIARAGTVSLTIKAKGKARRKLARTGTVKVQAKLTYSPVFGAPNTQGYKVTLRKKVKRTRAAA